MDMQALALTRLKQVALPASLSDRLFGYQRCLQCLVAQPSTATVTSALCVAGDTTLNLLWRVQHGEGPTFSPKVAVVLIGTNDLTNPLYQLVS